MHLPSRKILLWLVPVVVITVGLARAGSLAGAWWFVPLCAGLLVANVWVFLRRGWEDTLYPTDYASLNYPLDMPSVRRWRVGRDHVLRPEIVWARTPEAWQVLIDDQPIETIPGGRSPCIQIPAPLYDGLAGQTLTECKRRCTLRPLPAGFGPDLNFTVYGLITELYRRGGMQWPADDAFLVYTDLPVGNFARSRVSDWADDYRYLPADSLAAADRVVREDMGVTAADSTITRMEKVARHLRTKLANAGGIPKDDARWIDPWRLWEEMTGGTCKGWCTQHAQLFAFFANRAGVPTRFVFGANVEGKARIVYTGHSWCESWVKEEGRWAFVDNSQALLCVRNRQGALLNTADLLHLCAHETFDGLTARVYAVTGKLQVLVKDWATRDLAIEVDAGGFANVPFAHVSALYRQEFGRQAIIKYRRPPNVEDVREVYSMLLKDWTFAWVNFDRYFFSPPPAYSLLETDGRRTYRLRQSLLLAWLSSAVLLAGYLARG